MEAPSDDDGGNNSLPPSVPSPDLSVHLVLGNMPERRNRASPANTTVWACTECKRRKGKCSGDSPCTFCRKTNRSCNYEARPVRLPLTRKNLDYLQSRCAKLESLIRTLDPSIDIGALLSGGAATPDAGNDTSQEDNDEGEEGEGEGEEETFPESACGFEWHEFSDPDVDSRMAFLSDGMANLNVDSRDVGYLGTSSGAALLRTVHRLVSRHHEYSLLPPPSPLYISPINYRVSNNLASSAISSILIDSYFTYYHPSYPLIQEPIFRLKCADLSAVPESSPWRLIYYMILTLGAFNSHSGSIEEDIDLDLRIWNLVRSGLSTTSILESGTLEHVHALALIGHYLQKRDRPNTGYNMMGAAVRMALGLGLHRDFAEAGSQSPSTLGRDMRRRTWWLLYIFDVGASITFGRPTVVNDRAETRIPANVDDSMLNSPSCILPPPTTALTPYSAMIAHAHLIRVANRIHSFSASRHRHRLLSRDLIYAFDAQILAWRNSLPPHFAVAAPVPRWFCAPRIVVLCKELNLRMIMYKRFLPLLSKRRRGKEKEEAAGEGEGEGEKKRRRGLGASLPDRDAMVCLSLALETIGAVRAFIDSETLRRGVAWYCTYFAFQAALVLVIAMLKTEEQEQVWIEGIESAEECFKAAKGCLGDGAQRCLDVLRRVGKLWKKDGDGGVPSVLEMPGSEGEDAGGCGLLAGMEGWSGGVGLGGLGFSTQGMGVPELELDSWMAMDTHGYEDLVLDPSLFVQNFDGLDEV